MDNLALTKADEVSSECPSDTKANIAQMRLDAMWTYQSPTIPASNPHPPLQELHAPRLKGPYQPLPKDLTKIRKERMIFLNDGNDYSLLE